MTGGFIVRKAFRLFVCMAILLLLIVVTGSIAKEELPGLDVYVVGQHAYVSAGAAGLYVVDIHRPAKPK